MQVRLRQIERKDLYRLRDWRNSEWLRPYVREYRLLNMINQRDWFDHISRDPKVEMFGIEAEVVEYAGTYPPDITTYTHWYPPGWQLVGVCGLCNIDWVGRSAEVSIYVAAEYQGQGIGLKTLELLRQKAFTEFNLHRLWAEVYDFNEASLKLFEEAGYEREGRMRGHVFKNDEYHDSLIYGRMRDDETD